MRSNFKSCFVVNFEYISHLCSSVSIVNFEHVIAGWERPSLINPQWIEAATRAEAYNSFKKGSGKKCFPVNFVKFLRTLFLQNTSVRLLLHGLTSDQQPKYYLTLLTFTIMILPQKWFTTHRVLWFHRIISIVIDI